jgi:hypothetical protein
MMIAGEYMNTQEIIATIDVQISKLQHAKALLEGTDVKKPIGRPKKIILVTKPAKRTMSPEGKAKIAQAQRLRWAKSKKASKKATKAVGHAKAI